jgi:hypothetical protein
MDIEDQINGLRRLAAEVPLCWLVCFEDRPLQGIPPRGEGPHLLLFSSKIKAESFSVNRRKYFGEEPLSLVQVDAPEKLKALTFLPSRDVRYSTPPCGIVFDFDYETGKAHVIISPKKIGHMFERDILQKLGMKIAPVTLPVATPAPVPTASSVPAMEPVPQPIPLQVINPIPTELPATPVAPVGRKLPPKTVFFASVALAAVCLLAISIFAVGIILGHGNIAALPFLSFGRPTPTMTPTATPTPTPIYGTWQTVVRDNFDNNENGWKTGTQEDDEYGIATLSILQGKYDWSMVAKKEEGLNFWVSSPFASQSNCYVAVDIRLVKGSTNNEYGLFLRANEKGMYFFTVNENKKEFYFWIYFDNQWKPLLDSVYSDQIRSGETNTLAVKAEGDLFSLFINGSFVGETYDDTISIGGFGLRVMVSGKGENDYEFDNFEIRAP